MKLFSLLILLLCTVYNGYSQKKNIAYIEIAGNAGTIASINYERIIYSDKIRPLHFALRGGLGIGTNRFDSTTTYNVPIEVNAIYGKKHAIEMGLGWTAYIGASNLSNPVIPPEYKSNFDYGWIIRLGYRFVSNSNVLIRVAPLAEFKHPYPKSTALNFEWGIGISLGYCW
jgi:hypothetical protein